MKTTNLLTTLIVLAVAGCDSVLEVELINDITEEKAITDALGARAAVAGIYDALQDDDYYGEAFLTFGDLPSEDVAHTGTFSTYADTDANRITADNTQIEAIWDALYVAAGRANIVIEKLPEVPDLEASERDQLLGEAYFLRALSFHNAVRLWGDSAGSGLGVPIRTTVPKSVPEAAEIRRATTQETYTQILSDLDQAEQLMSVEKSPRRASLGAVRALRARVHLYREEWTEAENRAEQVVAMGYNLAPNYSDLFSEDGAITDEDILKVQFNLIEFSLLGFFYRARGEGGRGEVAPTATLEAAYPAGDLRKSWNISFTTGTTPRRFGSKWPTGDGDEDIYVIRFAEVLLIKAEAEARLTKLDDAITSINPIRERAGLLPLSAVGMTQEQVLDAILFERRLELAMEGDRWPDLVRRGQALIVLGITDRPEQRLFPIPLNELDVAPGLVQNPGY